MPWRLEGTYFEHCPCDMVCPCTTSGITMPADTERCRVVLVYHIDSGEIDGVVVRGLTVAVLADTPRVMADGDWRVGMFMDAAASEEQGRQVGRSILRATWGAPGGTERADRGQSEEGTKEFFKTLASLVYVLQGFWCGVCGVASGPMTRSPARCGSHAGSTYGTGVPPHPSLGIASRVAHRRGDWATWG